MEHAFDINMIGLREVKSESRLYRWEIIHHDAESAPEVDVQLSTHFFTTPGSNIVTLRVGANYTILRSMIRRKLLDYVAEATFELTPGAGEYEADSEEMIVSTDVVRVMLSLTIGAIRGMIAVKTADTFLARHPLPVYNLDTLIDNMVASHPEINLDGVDLIGA